MPYLRSFIKIGWYDVYHTLATKALLWVNKAGTAGRGLKKVHTYLEEEGAVWYCAVPRSFIKIGCGFTLPNVLLLNRFKCIAMEESVHLFVQCVKFKFRLPSNLVDTSHDTTLSAFLSATIFIWAVHSYMQKVYASLQS